tara:strand:+ start:66 stop:485 length:420 start_codon:yes stop_codon:yes gene_type:complete
MARSPSNKGLSKNKYNGSSRSIGRNPGGMVAGLTAGTTFGEGKEIKEQVEQGGGLPNTARESTLRKAQQEGMQRRGMKPPAIDVFAATDRKSEPVTSGLDFGPGINPPATNQVLQAEEIRNFVYDSWLETGDDSLLEFL